MNKNIFKLIAIAWILSIIAFHSHQFILGILSLTVSFVIFVWNQRETSNAREKFHFILEFEVHLPNVLNHPLVEKDCGRPRGTEPTPAG
jgi:hypothetical protein